MSVEEVPISNDAQQAWLAVVGGHGKPVSLETVAARIAYHAGLAMEPPPTEKDAWQVRARAAVAELHLLGFLTPGKEEGTFYTAQVETKSGRVLSMQPNIQNLPRVRRLLAR